MNLLSSILIQPNVITEAGINFILDHAKKAKRVDVGVFDADESNKTKETQFNVDKNERNTQGIDIIEILPQIVELYKKAVTHIINPFYKFEIFDSEVPQLLSYSKDGFYNPHCDSESLWKNGEGKIEWKKSSNRDLSTILFLNNDFTGGDLIFPDLKIRIRPEPGMLVCFPSNHNYIHGVEPVLSGERFSMVNWMTIKQNIANPDLINNKGSLKEEKEWHNT